MSKVSGLWPLFLRICLSPVIEEERAAEDDTVADVVDSLKTRCGRMQIVRQPVKAHVFLGTHHAKDFEESGRMRNDVTVDESADEADDGPNAPGQGDAVGLAQRRSKKLTSTVA